MTKTIVRSVLPLALLGALTYAVVQGTACSDDNNNADGAAGTTGTAGTTGGGGTTGAGGTSGGGGTGGTATGDGGMVTYTVQLSGAMEFPAVTSSGTGTAMVTLDPIAKTVTVTGTFSGLSSAATMAHIHGLAPAGMNASVIVPLTATAATSGTISGTGTLTPEQVVGMGAGQTYVNIHTADHTGGEIRGQINP